MTNEQLYLLLEWLGDGLEREIDALRLRLADTEREPIFYDALGRKVGSFGPGPSLEDYAEEHGYEIRYDGDLVALRGLKSLLRRLRERDTSLRR